MSPYIEVCFDLASQQIFKYLVNQNEASDEFKPVRKNWNKVNQHIMNRGLSAVIKIQKTSMDFIKLKNSIM